MTPHDGLGQPVGPALSAVFGVRGPLDPAAFSAAVGGLVARHEALRSLFRSEAGQPYQVVIDPDRRPAAYVDLEGLTPDRRQMEARRLTRQQVLQPFDLSQGPLLRVLLIRLESQRHRMLLVLHHIVADGWSLGLMVREMEELYSAAEEMPGAFSGQRRGAAAVSAVLESPP